jgi:hypothetical protein
MVNPDGFDYKEYIKMHGSLNMRANVTVTQNCVIKTGHAVFPVVFFWGAFSKKQHGVQL